jgi:acetyl/propionyl-CoA carboxylase alpha subunit
VGQLRRVLIANRGEIAARIITSAAARGMTTVLACSAEDRFSMAAMRADEVALLRGASVAETYLDVDQLVAAALAAGADCVHPGYGFLSEDARFAEAVEDAGLTFIGPSPAVISQMGSKVAAKALMDAAGVPVLGGAVVQTPDDVAAVAATEGWPLLLKASAGGGGRGMRVLHGPDEVAAALPSAAREAAASFGDATIFVEPYILRPRHVEVQIFGDQFGTVVDLFERDCSIQRRHQKVVEESPSPSIDEGLRTELRRAARQAGASLGYVGAGTVEFIVRPDGRFAFLEVNTRLQVEHPVTEMVTGLDLVDLQFHVAEGGALPEAVVNATTSGHAIEVRLYAEDPSAGFLPSTGTLEAFDLVTGQLGQAMVRVDAAVELAGETVTTTYDPLLAKVIAWAPTRAVAAAALATTLRTAAIAGLTTNRDLLIGVLEDPDFLDGIPTTAYVEDRDVVAMVDAVRSSRAPLLAVAALSLLAKAAGEGPLPAAVPVGFRNVLAEPQVLDLVVDGHTEEVALVIDGDRADVLVGGDDPCTVVQFDAEGGLVLQGLDLVMVHVSHLADGGVEAATNHDRIVAQPAPRFLPPSATRAPGSLTSPLPGTVVRVDVRVGDEVAVGDPLVVIEAMKMEHTVRAPAPGVVAEVAVAALAQVAAHDLLVRLEEVAGA